MIFTKYYDSFNKEKPLQDYPRPQLVRNSYLILNGLWDFTITNSSNLPNNYNSTIVVPYCVESYLSGINKNISKDSYLYYRKYIKLNNSFLNDIVLLHFDAIDQVSNIYINKQLVHSNNNGYLPIVVDIRPYLIDGNNEIIVQVKDNLSNNYPYGKQKEKHNGMWYSPVSGIWQSVWLEAVSNDYIKNLTITPHIETSSVTISIDSNASEVLIIIKCQDKIIYEKKSNILSFDIEIDNPILWSPENPFLYDLIIKTKHDKVLSYFALRSFTCNNNLFFLNGKKYFIHGILDQGYFPEGIYTPSSYRSYKDDILIMKKLGFNCLRKHVKIEPLIFYHYCDKYGMLVFQDFVNIGKYSFVNDTFFPTLGLKNVPLFKNNISIKARNNFKNSLIETANHLYNVCSIVYYTIFNEGWGQHDTDSYYQLLKSLDNTRIVDSASGWFKNKLTDVNSLHIYFKKIKFTKSDKPIIVSEFGGYSYKTLEHIYLRNANYGYKKFNDLKDYNEAIYNLYKNEIIANIKNNLAGCIYTQLSDVEEEINGLLTYDRKVLKVDEKIFLKVKYLIEKEFYNG